MVSICFSENHTNEEHEMDVIQGWTLDWKAPKLRRRFLMPPSWRFSVCWFPGA